MIPPRDIIQAVAEESGIGVRSLLDKCRLPYLVRPRQLAMVLLRERGGLSYMNVGLEMDRAESAVWEGCISARKRLGADPAYRALHDRVAARLQALEPAE